MSEQSASLVVRPSPRAGGWFAFLSLVLVALPASAQGLAKVNTLLDQVLTVLRGASVAVVTIAIIWAGYKFLFKHAEIGECAKILGGGILIGGAAEIARLVLG